MGGGWCVIVEVSVVIRRVTEVEVGVQHSVRLFLYAEFVAACDGGGAERALHVVHDEEVAVARLVVYQERPDACFQYWVVAEGDVVGQVGVGHFHFCRLCHSCLFVRQRQCGAALLPAVQDDAGVAFAFVHVTFGAEHVFIAHGGADAVAAAGELDDVVAARHDFVVGLLKCERGEGVAALAFCAGAEDEY